MMVKSDGHEKTKQKYSQAQPILVSQIDAWIDWRSKQAREARDEIDRDERDRGERPATVGDVGDVRCDVSPRDRDIDRGERDSRQHGNATRTTQRGQRQRLGSAHDLLSVHSVYKHDNAMAPAALP